MKSKVDVDWGEVKLIDVIQFNPRESIKRGTIAKKIGMDKLTPFQKILEGFELAKYSSGTKFRNGDTLLARITPCLQNGKTAQVTILEENEIGFGSTEFIVLREKEKLSINDFIYYLSLSPTVKDTAIKSMTGTSGRQRAQRDVIENKVVKFPPLQEQRGIADTLSSLDTKIQLNNKINKNLETQAQTIFKHWFVDFEFPDKNGNPYKSSGGDMIGSELGMIPKEWGTKPLDQLISRIDNRGKTPPYEEGQTSFPLLDVATLRGNSRIINYDKVTKYVSEKTYNNWFRNGHPKERDILMSTVGSLAEMKIFMGDIGCIAQNVVALRSKGISEFYLYEYLKFIKSDLVSYDIGTVQPSIKITHIINHHILVPEEEYIKKYNDISEKISMEIHNNNLQNQKLAQLRDTLLPKLMNGEIRIPLDK